MLFCYRRPLAIPCNLSTLFIDVKEKMCRCALIR